MNRGPRSSRLTIDRPLMPIIKSNHGSIGISRLWLRKTWNPYAELVAGFCGWSESSLDMKRLRAPNMFAIASDVLGVDAPHTVRAREVINTET